MTSDEMRELADALDKAAFEIQQQAQIIRAEAKSLRRRAESSNAYFGGV
jgi:methyl-accepting chemotaxis protein